MLERKPQGRSDQFQQHDGQKTSALDVDDAR